MLRSIRTAEAFRALLQEPELLLRTGLAADIARRYTNLPAYELLGHCAACEATRDLLVDRQWGGRQVQGVWVPAWRERLECTVCHLISRQRFMVDLVRQALEPQGGRGSIYMTEAITGFAHWAARGLAGCEVVGSEYLPSEEDRRRLPAHLRDARHEDVQALSFEDARFDLAISNDVLEHVPDPGLAFAELARVLRPGGQLLLSVPMDLGAEVSVTRARLGSSGPEHLLEPVYHGNPVDAEGGSLVFTDFGWDVLEQLEAAGFTDAEGVVGYSEARGYVGTPLVIVRARR